MNATGVLDSVCGTQKQPCHFIFNLVQNNIFDFQHCKIILITRECKLSDILSSILPLLSTLLLWKWYTKTGFWKYKETSFEMSAVACRFLEFLGMKSTPHQTPALHHSETWSTFSPVYQDTGTILKVFLSLLREK